QVAPASSGTSRAGAEAGCSPGSMMPVTGVQAPLSRRRTASRRVRAGSSTKAVTPGIHNSSCPNFSRRARTNSGVGMLLLLPPGLSGASEAEQQRQQRDAEEHRDQHEAQYEHQHAEADDRGEDDPADLVHPPCRLRV